MTWLWLLASAIGLAAAKCLRLGLAWLSPKWLGLALAGGLASARLFRLGFG